MEKYRKISHWTLGVIVIVMFSFIIWGILAKNDFVDGEFIFIGAFYFVIIAFVVVFLLLVSCLLKALLKSKEERKSYLYTSLIFFLSILLLAIPILVFVLLGVFFNDYKG